MHIHFWYICLNGTEVWCTCLNGNEFLKHHVNLHKNKITGTTDEGVCM